MPPDSLSCSSFVFKIQVTSSSSTHYHSNFLYIKYFFLHFSIGEKEFSVPLKPQFSHFHKLHCMLFKPLKPHPWKGAPPLTNQAVLKKNNPSEFKTAFLKSLQETIYGICKKNKIQNNIQIIWTSQNYLVYYRLTDTSWNLSSVDFVSKIIFENSPAGKQTLEL